MNSGDDTAKKSETVSECSADVSANASDEDNFFRQISIEFLVHELKAPVSVIEAGATLMLDKKKQHPLSTSQARTLQRILRNARKTHTMLAELLEVGRAQSACFNCHSFLPVPVLQEVLGDAVEAVSPELYDQTSAMTDPEAQRDILTRNGIRLDASEEAAASQIEHDETKFRQIVGNMIKNGLQYKRRHLLIRAVCRHTTFTVSIRDDGPGIAKEHHEAIFQRYRQVAPCAGIARTGHGLGLAVSRLLARSMGGDIQIESDLGQGALFRFALPMRFPET